MMLKLLTAGLLVAGTAVPAAAADNSLVAQADAVPTPALNWARCTEEGLQQYECAIADVPLDYAKPRGATLGIAVLRQRATGDRIGTLFTAVGGPGGSGIDAAKDGLASAEIARRFDVVTFDQRGVVRSRQVKCFSSPEEQAHFWDTIPMPPATPAEEKRTTQGSKAFADGCARHSADLVNNLTTVDVARDLDLLRRAVGDAKLTYTGGSYASYIGEVYGALFGDRVRALQLNAMMDPVSYSTSTLNALWERAEGTAGVWAEFARLCTEAGKPACAFAGPDVSGRNASLLARLKNGPITVGRGDAAVQVRYQDLVPAQVSMLYDTQQGWPALAAILDAIERGPDGDPQIAGAILGGAGFRLDFLSSFIAITCADVDLPKAPGLWPLFARASDANVPHYGRHWLYMAQPCATWPQPKQRYTGPWRLKSGVPALLINNRFDPVTPLTMAVKAQRAMGNARLVVVEGHGHSIVGTCTDKIRADYLIDLRLPAEGASCEPDRPPFDGV
ncbi:alpha/beta hydrolase [Kibdelosporangium aridum]|uniref:Alpha/beta hydrolase fold n=1 Tax=Kibdelosporangium aridum TaxID=2030 RepID=A0A1Y5X169_KIBAR|nr:alpha/beta hydrolase [Kibdelosporangium aridum]SMC58948.1 alpha/beta hydrolase fold [Kibdelosporangium aridum]